MKQRLTYMKYIAVIAVALLSFVVAIPISKETVRQHIQLDKVIVKTETKPKASATTSVKTTAAKAQPTPVAQPTTTHTQAAAPVAQPTPAPQVVTASFSCENYKSYFEQYSWNASTAMAICQAESSGDPSAVGCHNYDRVCDYGLMQLHGIDILDAAQNIAYAYYHKYLTQGWGAWSTYNSGAYYKYL